MLSLLAAVLRDRKGATAVEYGLILALVVLAVMIAIMGLGSTTRGLWNNVSTKVDDATPG